MYLGHQLWLAPEIEILIKHNDQILDKDEMIKV